MTDSRRRVSRTGLYAIGGALFFVSAFMAAPRQTDGKAQTPPDAKPQAGQKYTHPGHIIDMTRRTALEARALAYRAGKAIGGNDTCPIHDGPLVETESKKETKGYFEIALPANDPAAYFMQYCAAGYSPRPISNNPNVTDGTSVSKTPIGLVLSEEGMKARNINPNHEFLLSLTGLIESARDEVQYVHKANPKTYRTQYGRLEPGDQALIMKFVFASQVAAANGRDMDRQGRVSAQPVLLQVPVSQRESALDTTNVLRNLLNGLTSDLLYLRSANKEAYANASKAFASNAPKAFEGLLEALERRKAD